MVSSESSPPRLRRGGAPKGEPDRAKHQEKRRGGAGQTNDFMDQHHPSLGLYQCSTLLLRLRAVALALRAGSGFAASALPSSAEEGRSRILRFFVQSQSHVIAVFLAALAIAVWLPSAEAQQQPQGFAVERFYPGPPGSGWFIMDDLNMGGGLGGAVTLTSGYSRNPLDVTSPDGRTHLPVVSDAAFLNVGVAGTYDRYRIYFNFPMPFALGGTGGMLGLYQLTAPVVSPGTNPDNISDPGAGFDLRIAGAPGSPLRIGAGGQLIFPSGERADYASDGTYRGLVRFLAAGDRGQFSYAGQLGVHIRPLNDSPVPGSPNGSELLCGTSIGRRFSFQRGLNGLIGPEIYGETAFHSFFDEQRTAVEGLLTAWLEHTGSPLRFKLGAGHGFVQHFGVPEWRVVFGVELLGQRN